MLSIKVNDTHILLSANAKWNQLNTFHHVCEYQNIWTLSIFLLAFSCLPAASSEWIVCQVWSNDTCQHAVITSHNCLVSLKSCPCSCPWHHAALARYNVSLIYSQTYNWMSPFDVQCWLLIRAVYSQSSVVGVINDYYCSAALYSIMNGSWWCSVCVPGEWSPHIEVTSFLSKCDKLVTDCDNLPSGDWQLSSGNLRMFQI